MSQILLLYGLSLFCLLLARSTHLWGQDPLFFVFQDLLLTVVEFRQPRQHFAQDAEFMPRKKTVQRDLSHRGKKARQLVLGTEGILSSPVGKSKQSIKQTNKQNNKASGISDLWLLKGMVQRRGLDLRDKWLPAALLCARSPTLAQITLIILTGS